MSTPMRVLVVDDSLTIRKLVEIALRGRPYEVDYAATGTAGVRRALETTPDLVLCDYVLPDLKGIEVCREIRKDDRCRRVEIAVISGKRDQIRTQFDGLNIVEFLPKPFTTDDIVHLVETVARSRKAAAPPNRETAQSLASSFRAALYGVLCNRLARIPDFAADIGSEMPATFFARRLFTESVMAELFEAIMPVYQQTQPRQRDKSLIAEGHIGTLRPARLLDLVVKSGTTSELVIKGDRGTTVFFASGGRLYVGRGSAQTATPAELAQLLRGSGGTFTWRALRAIGELAAEICDEPLPLPQLELECLRTDADLPLPALAAVMVRVPRFSDRLQTVSLNDEEQQVLSLVDGSSTVAEVGDRSRLPLSVAQTVVARLSEIGLLRRRAPDDASLEPAPLRVVIIEPDDHGFREPLARFLARRHPGASLVSMPPVERIAELLSPRPGVVIVNATLYGELALELARTLERRADLGGVRMIAVLETPAPIEDELTAAGCETVLTKPVHTLDLDWMFEPAAPATAPPSMRGSH